MRLVRRVERAFQRGISTCLYFLVVRLNGFHFRSCPLDDEDEQLLAPYRYALGEAALEWNKLQETLGLLFGTIIQPVYPMMPSIALAVWHSIKSDRTQRDILSAAANARFTDAEKTFTQAKADIKWLLDEVNKLADSRNNVVHSPMVVMGFATQGEPEKTVVRVSGFDMYGNPRATALNKQQDILGFFAWSSECSKIFDLFTQNLIVALIRSSAWPSRPQLPNRGQKKTHPSQHHQPGQE